MVLARFPRSYPADIHLRHRPSPPSIPASHVPILLLRLRELPHELPHPLHLQHLQLQHLQLQHLGSMVVTALCAPAAAEGANGAAKVLLPAAAPTSPAFCVSKALLRGSTFFLMKRWRETVMGSEAGAPAAAAAAADASGG
jgi:hypothetical protein